MFNHRRTEDNIKVLIGKWQGFTLFKYNRLEAILFMSILEIILKNIRYIHILSIGYDRCNVRPIAPT